MTTALEQNREDQALGAALRRVLAHLPRGPVTIERSTLRWSVEAGEPLWWAPGGSPEEALRNLADDLDEAATDAPEQRP